MSMDEGSSFAFFDNEIHEGFDVASQPIDFGKGRVVKQNTENKLIELLKIHEPVSLLDQVESLLSSAITTDYPVRTSADVKMEISRDAEHYIKRQKNFSRYKSDINKIGNRILDFLKQKEICAKISVNLFSDPEYTNWAEPRIQIIVPSENLQKTYELFNDLLEYSFVGVSRKTLKKVVITIDSK